MRPWSAGRGGSAGHRQRAGGPHAVARTVRPKRGCVGALVGLGVEVELVEVVHSREQGLIAGRMELPVRTAAVPRVARVQPHDGKSLGD